MRILFVHGTGVRREQHDALFGTIRDGLAKLPEAGAGSGYQVEPCYWGDEFGATLGADGASIPKLSGTRGVGGEAAVGPLDQAAADWLLLLTDPLCELRVLAELGDTDGGIGRPGVQAAGAAIAEQLDAYPSSPPADGKLAELLRNTGLTDYFSPALESLRTSEEFTQAAAAATASDAAAELTTATARALVATLLSAAGTEALCTGAERNELVNLMTEGLGGSARLPGARVAAFLGRLALRVSTQPALNHWRGSITRNSTPALGDILRYQARGGPLREFLHRRIASAPGPTVLLGHSLGGVALVDLLALRCAQGEPLAGVELLVTVGSQAPLLYELGASVGLEPGRPLPSAFPLWLNIYDRQDLLAYLAAPVFPGHQHVADHEVSSGQPFPTCHSAYWKLPGVYQRIAKAIGEAEAIA
ncbi:hypothetical protein P3T37_001679 [Kitasatospora sp. MAA4]|uniref:hypothetical protein n=1 Tax=Kitasatospora sp. MAA4 TaxID=3035093 RepID=UPI002474E777|nr:hypothetical protein [Kitasatospora sp. MAA4]MDH6132294.1 hypothetical protein [Kitasatospora sp. MAA4]